MNNFTTKKAPKQRINREKQRENAKHEWNEEALLLANEKAKIGYKDFSWDAFLQISALGVSFSTSDHSRIIALHEKYSEHCKRREILWAEDNVIEEFNKQHAIVHSGQTYILSEKTNRRGGHDFTLESRQSFRAYYEDERIICFDGKELYKADIWLKSNKRRKYSDIIFDPTTTESIGGYNIWKGYAKIPKQGDSSLYWAHVKENICNNNEESYTYLRKWIANIFQYPHIVHTAIVLCGSQGVGKNSFVEPLGTLLGATHYAPLSSISELVSNFNAHLKNAVLIHANEALWKGNVKEIGVIKAMITDPWCLIESKGKDRIQIENCRHLILSSNEDWPVHLDPDDRRFFVLRVSDAHKEDHEYFKQLRNELENGGYEALLYDLLHEDIKKFEPRRIPSTSVSFAIKMRSANSSCRYLYEVLKEGGFSIGEVNTDYMPVWQAEISKEMVYQDYVCWCKNNGELALSQALFSRNLNKILISVTETRPGKGGRKRCYKFSSLIKTREEFAKAFKENPKHIFEDNEIEASISSNYVQDQVQGIDH